MEWLVVAVVYAGFGAATHYVARRKGRRSWWWFVAGALGGLPVLLLAAFASPAGEPWRFRSPMILLAIAVALIVPLTVLVLIAQYT